MTVSDSTIDYSGSVFSQGYRAGFFAESSDEHNVQDESKATYREAYIMGESERDCPVEYLSTKIREEIARRQAQPKF